MGDCGLAYVDRVDVTLVVAVHVAIGQETVRKKGKENEFGKSEKLIARECESRAAAVVSYVQLIIGSETNRSSNVIFSSEPVQWVSTTSHQRPFFENITHFQALY